MLFKIADSILKLLLTTCLLVSPVTALASDGCSSIFSIPQGKRIAVPSWIPQHVNNKTAFRLSSADSNNTVVRVFNNRGQGFTFKKYTSVKSLNQDLVALTNIKETLPDQKLSLSIRLAKWKPHLDNIIEIENLQGKTIAESLSGKNSKKILTRYNSAIKELFLHLQKNGGEDLKLIDSFGGVTEIIGELKSIKTGEKAYLYINPSQILLLPTGEMVLFDPA